MNGDSVDHVGVAAAEADPRARRRAARRAGNREEILDAAEQVFGEFGVHDGSLRQIAQLAGFSTASIYLFFENKQDLLTQTLLRGVELNKAIRAVAESDLLPLDKLHRIVDVTQTFFESRPHFRRLLRRIAGDAAIVGPSLAAHSTDIVVGAPTEAMSILAGVVEEAQRAGEVRAGNPYAIARLYAVLVNEHVHLAADPEASPAALTLEQFHGLVDGLLHEPRSEPVRPDRSTPEPGVGRHLG